ncbi:ATP-binding cassette domain-containing protein [Oceanobacillus neutriphilus]|uniref:Lsa family ABC-F type ribosomal protection protein n=1 Tax=Oceanobacillus neutriphilus TaxID=531815 RepID=A0ABQ2P2G5_9BACI|nr:ATP-binding cassette domain-containing protein [Oceanobacillus neutriphilus]GGP16355.1 Lsa family ABC-F type ribosomal protection protein [Oceanobacillus neutriphilus]
MAGNILISNLSFKYPSMIHPLFENITVNIDENWKLGLLGRNGRGKTSFFKILLGDLDYDGNVQSSLIFKYFPIFPAPDNHLTAEEVLLQKNPMVERWELEMELSYMDLPAEVLDRDFYVLSGGEQTKILLVELFLNEGAFPLIDEPTNNLDVHGRKVVGDYLNRKKGFIVVSHDQHFLNQFVDHTMAINKESIDVVKGDIDTWAYEKKNADELAEEKNQKLHHEINRLETVSKRVGTWGQMRENSSKDAAERRLAAKQMKRSKAIKKRTEEKIVEKQALIHNVETVEALKMRVDQPHKQVLLLRDFSILQNGRCLFEPVNIDVYPSERLFITGKNGAGKTTLLNFILGNGQFEVTGDYQIRLPDKISLLQQQNQLDEDHASILQQLTAEEKQSYLHLLRQLGSKRSSFADRSSDHWSSGEQKKVFLANALLGNHSLFVWDEVTNYLDMMVIDQLIAAINKYKPTMIGVDHNEHFVSSAATKTLELIKKRNR